MFDNQITLTDEALVMAIKAYEAEQNKNQYLRIGCRGGGCSGFTYVLEFTTEIDPEDDIVEELDKGLRIVSDVFSLQYLNGVTVDYVTSLRESGFKFNNPKPNVRTCGCGGSFSG